MTQAAMNAMELNMNDMAIISGGELTEVRKQTLLGLMKISKKLATSKEHVLEWCRTNGLDQEENDNDHPPACPVQVSPSFPIYSRRLCPAGTGARQTRSQPDETADFRQD